MKIVTDAFGIPIHSLDAPVGGYAPADLQSAYGLPGNSGPGAGKIVAIFGGNSDYPNAESDLAVYRSQYGLPPCTSANGCFMKIDQNGGTNYPSPGSDEGEQALDMEMASAACPACKIILIEGPDAAVMLQTLIGKGAVAWSFSIDWSAGAQNNAQWCQSSGFNSPGGILITAALGDSGYPGTVDWAPTACQGALAVGGTTLNKAATGRGWAEIAWSGTGSGCATAVNKPAWQTDPGCSMRMAGDVAAVADPGTGVSFYCTTGPSGWGVVGGTSVAAPFTAGALTALGIADGKFSPSWVWSNSANFYDVTSGSNGACNGSPAYVCNAQKGYDGPTGWGTPNGALLLTALPPGSTGGACTAQAGSYVHSCSNCEVGMRTTGCALTCQSCTKIDGSENPGPTLGLPCNGDVSNNDGVLQCNQVSQPPDAGAVDAGGHDGGGLTDGGSSVDAGATDAAPPTTADAGQGVVGGPGAIPPGTSAHGGCSYVDGSGASHCRLILFALAILLLRRRNGRGLRSLRSRARSQSRSS
jgi:hypothetical protein